MAEFPAHAEGIVLTHFIVASDVDRSRRFYADVLVVSASGLRVARGPGAAAAPGGCDGADRGSAGGAGLAAAAGSMTGASQLRAHKSPDGPERTTFLA